jgi:hypothetical protein
MTGSLVEYRCRRCRRWLFSSDAEWGRLRLVCPNTRCREDQTIFLGGRRTMALHNGLAANAREQAGEVAREPQLLEA